MTPEQPSRIRKTKVGRYEKGERSEEVSDGTGQGAQHAQGGQDARDLISEHLQRSGSGLLGIPWVFVLTAVLALFALGPCAMAGTYNADPASQQLPELIDEGSDLRRAGKYRESASTLEKALAMARARKSPRDEIDALGVLALSYRQIPDLKRMLAWEKSKEYGGDHTGTRFWNRYMGVKGPDDPVLDTISPIKHIDRVNVPVLLIHGKDDTIVDYEQSEVMLKALQKANKPVELVTLKKEDHWLSRSETRLLMLQTSVAFLKANNPPD